MDRVTLVEAARLVDLHPNTVRNWRKADKLKSAEKVVENGVDVWLVDPQEVHQLAQESKAAKRSTKDSSWSDNTPQDDVYPKPYSGGPDDNKGKTATGSAQDSPGGAVSPLVEQNLAFFRESIVRPLVEANERQAAKIEDLSVQVGTLQERVRQLEARLAESVAPAQPPVAPAPRPPAAGPEPSPVLNRDTLQPVEPRKGFWQRLFGG